MNILDFIERIKLPFRKEKELYSSLYAITGFWPRNLEHYKLALMHKSVGKRNENGRALNNERLEFLGDAVLDAVVGDIVYRKFPRKREGFLTNARSKAVKRETLGRLARKMGLDSLIVCSACNLSHNSYMEGNAFEALVGALYLDRGYRACMAFMENRVFGQYIDLSQMAYQEVNFKSRLLEWGQKNRVHVEYRLVSQSKDQDSNPVFSYQVVLEGVPGCTGTGYTKKESHQRASRETLQLIRKKQSFLQQVFAAKEEHDKSEEVISAAETEAFSQEGEAVCEATNTES